jgi:hypothetical protein
MSSRQLQDLTPQELVDHVYLVSGEAKRAAMTRRATVGKALASAQAVPARLAVDQAHEASNPRNDDVARARARARAIAYLDILHRQQMLGEWPEHINRAVIEEQIHQATPSVIAEKDEVKKHMGSMLGDCDKAGKLSKRRIRKTKTKTKRRRHKNTKRRRK